MGAESPFWVIFGPGREPEYTDQANGDPAPALPSQTLNPCAGISRPNITIGLDTSLPRYQLTIGLDIQITIGFPCEAAPRVGFGVWNHGLGTTD
jgi:hypothetical protein